MPRIFGEIPGHPEGSWFQSRGELSNAGVHRPTQAGISGSGNEGADSIVLSGGYEDDRDFGDEILYTGHGGRSQDTRHQVADQGLTRGNLALALSCLHGLPVRVIRGHKHDSPYSPGMGYTYDGLYYVERYWREPGVSGPYVWRFKLRKADARIPKRAGAAVAEEKGEYEPAPRQPASILRIVRDTPQARRVKELYNYTCQVCGTRLDCSAGPYAEAAHIRPLGAPHNGPDTPDNILCLCPNHHVLFDHGGITIADDLSLLGEPGRLNLHPQHPLNREHLRYHRERFFACHSEE